ncbi:MAG: exodeoxyribonuclease VII small subunit [Candidatus Marinimicrobia bacterium]|jgi:exodeoxyribonuclease VII small subunit|nr:exodeoxyribonuclease VII small subunit [Candidatus Neomarinimicrobiota bacterium]MBT3632242.1 exodeoxyribonuclease VII small subunit [Candidatus Neomarinimicrobiota bacterium]MBT3825950.1 exodeoxyribonuclease VII small subunit [Candidatus Neomarinimicrobiota bacterium]MBT4129644.1 exodeoxyribonuclease VII small subunit [Candidatus Neomarinimicrobiota bacterium]MBT4294461.1 exodeoxyribonuclease VII small subunit [Candidatus Neomarinimicrobiota bacterium]
MSEKDKSFEDLMQELETLVSKLEGEDLKLDDAIKQNERALKLIHLCRDRLDSARQKIDKLVSTADGGFEKQALD